MRWWRAVVALAVAAMLAIGGFWLWGRPRTSVAVPGPSVGPTDFVRTYAQALDERDYSTADAMTVGDDVRSDARWWTLHGPRIDAITINHVWPVTTGHECGGLTGGWKQCRWIQTTATFRNWSGMTFDGKSVRNVWSYYLVRNSDSERWHIVDWGQP